MNTEKILTTSRYKMFEWFITKKKQKKMKILLFHGENRLNVKFAEKSFAKKKKQPEDHGMPTVIIIYRLFSLSD